MAEKSPFGQVDQIGIIVKDMDKAIKYYESLGIGPFLTTKHNYLSRELNGKQIPNDVVLTKVAQATSEGMQIELIQPVTEGTHWMEFLKKNGEGINHLGFHVDDLEKEEAKLVKQGFKVMWRSRFKRPDGSIAGGTYLDTGKVGGVLFELRGPVLK